jgi:hypothetical protein
LREKVPPGKASPAVAEVQAATAVVPNLRSKAPSAVMIPEAHKSGLGPVDGIRERLGEVEVFPRPGTEDDNELVVGLRERRRRRPRRGTAARAAMRAAPAPARRRRLSSRVVARARRRLPMPPQAPAGARRRLKLQRGPSHARHGTNDEEIRGKSTTSGGKGELTSTGGRGGPVVVDEDDGLRWL